MHVNAVCMIGCGNMGGAMLRGWQASGVLAEISEVHVLKRTAPAAEQVIPTVVYHTDWQSMMAVARVPEIVIVAVKPHQFPDILAECKLRFGTEPVYISIAAGVRLEALQSALGADARVVRAMPNTPVAIGLGMTGLCATPNVDAATRSYLQAFFASLGDALWLDETQMDAFTALAGSGPAYVYYFMECLAAAAVALGLDAAEADRITRQMVLGASALARASDVSVAALREQVTSPKGTTAAALDIWMQENTLEAQARKALQAAVARAQELSK